MRLLFIAMAFLMPQLHIRAQEATADYFKAAPPLKATKLIRLDNRYKFSSDKWAAVNNKEVWPDLFGIENGKMWTGQMVGSVRLAGYWKISEKAYGYMYAAYLENDEGTYTPSVFVSSFNIETNRKGIDVDPFSQAPSPTGMRGKMVITQTVQITNTGLFTLTNKHQSPAKVLSKTVKYMIGEDGAVETL